MVKRAVVCISVGAGIGIGIMIVAAVKSGCDEKTVKSLVSAAGDTINDFIIPALTKYEII